MSIILVQGLGCVETGTTVVLRNLISAMPCEFRFFVICTDRVAVDLVGRRFARIKNGPWILGLSHRWFGRWLRLPLEFMIAISVFTPFVKCVVNLSHYGICFGGNYSLYIHNLLLMDLSQPCGWSHGRPNKLNRWMLDMCILRARLLVLQTESTCTQLKSYCDSRSLSLPKYKLLRPLINLSSYRQERHYSFQLFYPTSRWPHKRADLAIKSVIHAASMSPGVGLVITIPENLIKNLAIREVGQLSRDEVNAMYAGSDALLFTSEIESLGLPILEAMSYGLPIIAPYLPYAIELLGDAGCYFVDPSPESVSRTVLDCRSNYGFWKDKIKARGEYIRNTSASWEQHWRAFINT